MTPGKYKVDRGEGAPRVLNETQMEEGVELV